MLSAQRLFKRALAEKLAFVPMGASQQAAGPGGSPVDPAAGGPPGMPPGGPPGGPPGMPPGAPMDPAMMGGPPGMPPGAPMDPAMMGGAPMDPAMMGGAPMDPAMMGGAPMDPAMMGGAPMDPAMMGGAPGGPAAGEPPLLPPEEPINKPETDVDDDGKPDTMVPLSAMKEFAIGIIEAMKGRATAPAKSESPKDHAKADEEVPAAVPGPVTGMPGFDPSMIPGGFKTASVLTRALRR